MTNLTGVVVGSTMQVPVQDQRTPDSGPHCGVDDIPQPASGTDAAAPEDPEYKLLLNSLDFAPTSVDALVERTGLTPDVVSSMLLMLELQGHVEASPGGRYSRVNKRS